MLAVVLLTFFFMVYGDSLQRNALALLPNRQQKRLTTEILQSIEREISRYVLTISVINAVVGLVFAAALYFLEVPLPEALLWGTMAAILNFAPYVGPLIGIVVMLLMGFVAFDDWHALVPAGIYLALHTLEGQILTPIVLGRQMRAVAADADPGADGVRLVVGHRRPAAGGAAAGVREAGAGADRGDGGVGEVAGVMAALPCCCLCRCRCS